MDKWEQVFSSQQINEAAAAFVKAVPANAVLAFHGQMGAGKTTFIGAVCKARGVQDVTGSPTYSIINQYNTIAGETVYHLDLYRLNSEEEAIQAGVEEVLYSGNLCLVEWPERTPDLLPPATLHVFIEVIDNATRRISCTLAR